MIPLFKARTPFKLKFRQYSMNQNPPLSITKYAQAQVPLQAGVFELAVYHNNQDQKEHLAVFCGDLKQTQPVFVRIHSECLTGEVLSSLKCDCKAQLENALAAIAKEGRGVMIYLRQEGRGIGLGNKIKAYALQNQGLDTIKANEALGLPVDQREFKIAAMILKDLGVCKIKLNTNNPDKIKAMIDEGLEVSQIIPSLSEVTEHNKAYLQTKFKKLGHKLQELFKSSQS
jgi:3,4-dihydroxy 2-butanone 4-phosphate synthase/GTP cyclohydrolase II